MLWKARYQQRGKFGTRTLSDESAMVNDIYAAKSESQCYFVESVANVGDTTVPPIPIPAVPDAVPLKQYRRMNERR
ncbi:hypothetical protein RRF57_000838 [Xylaria bambusicola]|uniref:Uncharacterized protein n=1 Tax=Xylaria bambusicola TaxID=326684 RepID=A0AAN7UCX1_9PEZI